jgi:hypothetical protein
MRWFMSTSSVSSSAPAAASSSDSITLVAKGKGAPSARIMQDADQDSCFRISCFLFPHELTLAKGLNRHWRQMLSPPPNQTAGVEWNRYQRFWRNQCELQRVHLISYSIRDPLRKYRSEKVTGDEIKCINTNIHKFSNKIFSLITEYLNREELAFNYEEQATFLFRGKISFYRDSWELNYPEKNTRIAALMGYYRWGNNTAEPCACVRVDSWDWDPPLGVERFPSYLPIRLFYKSDRAPKNSGDKIRVIWNGRHVLLTCDHRVEFCDSLRVDSFSQALQQRIQVSLNCNFVTEASVAMAQQNAPMSGEWVDADGPAPAQPPQVPSPPVSSAASSASSSSSSANAVTSASTA